MSDTQDERLSVGSRAAAISTRSVRLMNEYTGRGPTKARTYINENLVSIVFQDTLTKGEQSLIADGEAELVLALRKGYQRTMKEELVAIVEDVVERRVIAFLSDNHVEPDVAVESFVLEPQGDGPEP